MIRAKLDNVSVVVRNIDQFGIDVQEAAFYAVVEALQKAFAACKTMITASDHTLRELALMGHPYGFTHPKQIHDPDSIIHRQSGAYASGLRVMPPVAAQGYVAVGQIINVDPKDRWLQHGTTKMRARPWMQWIIQEYGDDLAALIEARIDAAIAKAKAAGR